MRRPGHVNGCNLLAHSSYMQCENKNDGSGFNTDTWGSFFWTTWNPYVHSFIHSGYFYSTSSSLLLFRGIPNYITNTMSELTRQRASGNCEWRTYVVTRVGFEPVTLLTQGTKPTTEPPRPSIYFKSAYVLITGISPLKNNVIGILYLCGFWIIKLWLYLQRTEEWIRRSLPNPIRCQGQGGNVLSSRHSLPSSGSWDQGYLHHTQHVQDGIHERRFNAAANRLDRFSLYHPVGLCGGRQSLLDCQLSSCNCDSFTGKFRFLAERKHTVGSFE